jgi:hypothetical protein
MLLVPLAIFLLFSQHIPQDYGTHVVQLLSKNKSHWFLATAY